MALSPNQQAVLALYREWCDTHDTPPTGQQLAERTTINPTSVATALAALRRKGIIAPRVYRTGPLPVAPLSPQEQETLAALRDWHQHHGQLPTQVVLSTRYNIRTTSIYNAIAGLTRKGFLTRHPDNPAQLVLVHRDRQDVTA
jgi:DNA-binding MarR family transcriptional regulator